MSQPFQPIAKRRNDRPSSWVGLEGAPLALDVAQELIGRNGKPTAPGHFFAHKVEGATTYLLWKPARKSA